LYQTNPVNNLDVSKRIADPVHGLIRLTAIEAKILEHPAFQRLREVTQLGMAKYVYPGAMHSRFAHSLGVLSNVTEIYDMAYRNWKRRPELSGEIEADLLFSEEMLQTTRIAAMCHDLGHFPFSHNLEESFDWMFKSRLISDSFRHEDLSALIIREVLGDILGDHTEKVAGLIDGDYTSLGQCLFPAFLVSSAIDGDRMDYLVRDALSCGVDQGRFDKERLLDSAIPYNTTINGRSHDVMAFKSKGIESIEQFLLARHRMHQTIYFNPSVIGFEAGLRRAYYMVTTDDPPWPLPMEYIDDPSKFTDFDEAEFFVKLKHELRKRKSWLVDPIINRSSLRKIGPFYHTIVEGQNQTKQSSERFALLKEKQDELEVPYEDWYGKDHWIYAEQKSQILVDPLPRSMKGEYGFEDAKSLKNVVLLVNERGMLVDPTDVSFGHTFLPFITGHSYHRFLFYTHKSNTVRIEQALQEVNERFNLG
jgi:HD superfamily phosphohydrolase